MIETVEANLKLKQPLDDGWNNQDWETFKKFKTLQDFSLSETNIKQLPKTVKASQIKYDFY